jgi:hypothetical protein
MLLEKKKITLIIKGEKMFGQNLILKLFKFITEVSFSNKLFFKLDQVIKRALNSQKRRLNSGQLIKL